MRRLILIPLAIGVLMLLGMLAARTTAAQLDFFTLAGAGPSLTAPSHTPGDSDHQWHPAHRTPGTVSESWKSMAAQAVPGGTRYGLLPDRTRSGNSPSAVVYPALHLHHTPLLI